MTVPPELSCRPSECPHRGGWVAVAFVFAIPAFAVGGYVGIVFGPAITSFLGWWTS